MDQKSLRPQTTKSLGILGVRALLLLVGLGLVVSSCERRPMLPLRTPGGERPNLLFITIDTLRADRISSYGYPQPTTPHLDRLAATGRRVATTIAAAPETAPAVASLLTGRYQHRSRVGANLWKLPGDVPTLATRLQNAGWQTGGIVTNLLISEAYGFAAGFDDFEFLRREALGSPSDARGAEAAIRWVQEHRGGSPWFLWLHFMDPHGPYDSAPASEFERFALPEGALAQATPKVSESNFGLGVLPQYQALAGVHSLGEYQRRYDAEIAWTDRQLGRVLEGLDEAERANTLIVVTADHGESLVEHEEFLQHGWFVYDTTLKVPLVFAMGKQLAGAGEFTEQVCAVDIAPTILELLGVTARADDVDGSSFALQVASGSDAPRRDCLAVGPRDNHPFALRSEGWKLIHTAAGKPPLPHLRAKDGPFQTPERWELYDLENDPGETDNLMGLRPEVAEEMQAKLAPFRRQFEARGFRW